jgi:2-keto-4-pentenoate hydratase/2-oxohepta-3-ene-1,7-dioic acid hydratase in catechol pathway
MQDGLFFEVPGAASVEQLILEGRVEEMRNSSGDLRGGIRVEGSRLAPPVLSPDKILLAADNYRAHTAEQKKPPPKVPYFFTKFRSCIIGNGDPILLPKVSKKADWECELAVVMGKKCKYASKGEALSYVAGYAVSNDVSFRDLQFPEGWPDRPDALGQNWVMGKALDSAFPLGPWLVTTDEIPDPQRLSLSLKVNGVQRQKASTEDMVFSVAELIEYISRGLTLLPGDIISTGTPAGVAYFTGLPFLANGDVIEAKIDQIGTITNPVVSEKQQERRTT